MRLKTPTLSEKSIFTNYNTEFVASKITSDNNFMIIKIYWGKQPRWLLSNCDTGTVDQDYEQNK